MTSREALIEKLVSNLVDNAKFWIRNGYTAEEGFAQALKSSCAGPLPRKIARERLGI